MPETHTAMSAAEWKHSLLQRLETNVLSFDEGAREIRQLGPKFLYRYRKAENHNHLESLLKGMEWMTPPLCFNDPYDSAFSVNWNRVEQQLMNPERMMEMWDALQMDQVLGPDEKEEIMKDVNPFELMVTKLMKKSRLPPSVLNAIPEVFADVRARDAAVRREGIRDQIRACCFSETPSSIQMWAYYAGMHTGFVIEYETADVLKMIGGRLLPVVYREELPDLTDCFLESGAPKSNRFMRACCIKEAGWAHEREWRLITLKDAFKDASPTKSHPIPMPRPKRVILGIRTKPRDRILIQCMCGSLGIECVGIKQKDGHFSLEPPPP